MSVENRRGYETSCVPTSEKYRFQRTLNTLQNSAAAPSALEHKTVMIARILQIVPVARANDALARIIWVAQTFLSVWADRDVCPTMQEDPRLLVRSAEVCKQIGRASCR